MASFSQQMLTALETGDIVEAQVLLEQAVKYDDADVLIALGEHLLEGGFLEESERVFLALKEKFPAMNHLNLYLAEIAAENDQIEVAFEWLEQIPKEDETYGQSLLVAADLYQMLGIPEVSENKIKEAQSYYPEEPLLDFALAELYFSWERYQEALPLYLALYNEGHKRISSVLISERIGFTESMLGSFEIAADYLEDAVKENQTDDNLFELGFVYLQLKEMQKAIALFQQLLTLNPSYLSAYFYLASGFLEEERLTEALTVAEEGLKLDPYQVPLYHLASEVAYRLHQKEKSETLLKEALKIADEGDMTRLTLSNLYLNQERYEEALAILSEMDEADNPVMWWNQAQAYNALEMYAEANGAYEKAAVDLHHEPEFMKDYGLFLREEGRTKEAKHLLAHYLEHVPDDLEIAELLAES